MKIRFLILTQILLTHCAVNTFAADNAAKPQQSSQQALATLRTHIALAPAKRPPLAAQEFAAVPLTREDAEQAEKLLWQDHAEMIKRTRGEEMKARRLTSGKLEMPFFYSVTGDKPKNGRSLYISMHGGGGAPKQVNDQQWENQKRLYRVDEGVYLAPRAPTDTWNLWHQGHIDGLFARLIENLIVLEGVDPNRVYLLGYSAGGDGVYQLAPRMADRFAAASMMAGHPNESLPLGLRNIGFSIHVGEKDSGYGRNKVAAKWGQQLKDLQKEDPQGYVHWTKIYAGKGHWLNREDAAALPWMAKLTRQPLPDKIVWRQDDVTHPRFYWLAVDPPHMRKEAVVRASRKKQHIDVQTTDLEQITIRVNDRMVDLDKDVVVTTGERVHFRGRIQRSLATIAKTLAERGDPASVFSGEIVVKLNSEKSE